MNGITNNRDTTRSQSFTYDQVNRIATAETSSTSGSNCWGEKFGYDQWANLLSIGAASSSYNGCTQENLSLSVNASNQIVSVAGYVYDAAGNLVIGAPGTSYTYNAESQVTLAQGVTYAYDGDGKRVQKSNGKLYRYGVGSDPIAESDLSGNITDEYVFFNGKRIARRDSAGNVVYYFADHLGTSRIVTNATGTILDDSDFYPFGGERVITSSSGNTYKFTGKERDSESSLDNFGARYDSSAMGRFMTPDSPSYSNHKNPQSWNLYAYSLNNPVTFRDADGHDVACGNNPAQLVKDANGATNGGGQVYCQTTTREHKFLWWHYTTSETKLAIKGDEASFRAKGQNASRLADLIDNHSFTLTVNYGNFDPHPGGSNSNMLSAGLSSPSVIIDPRRPNSGYDTDAIAQHLPEANTAEEFGHEVLGHQWGELINGDFLLDRSLWWHPMTNTTRANMRDSITGENAVRALDPTRGQKDITSHHNYDEAPEDGYKP
ncbi:MAG TPA: RHS repeat-associated core domain-containing protein [Candidatus Acidoferrales bacterium]|nr:RHS repeat-associated core domain-containing protein [Candidatus Acidoferrales bacterium]